MSYGSARKSTPIKEEKFARFVYFGLVVYKNSEVRTRTAVRNRKEKEEQPACRPNMSVNQIMED
ncbi:uncharacterized protein METZ01_LOCUS337200 [marine metagenome]|uniref:Uncharacterized protein n=1 Tax=marine metagenome TaxID=408172 RepID=A0A382QFZ1_9ZZZZ